MNGHIAKVTFALTLFLALAFQTSLGQQAAPGAPIIPRTSISVVPYYHSSGGCSPVEVKVIKLGGQPQSALLAHITIESFSAKPVRAVKIGWNVYRSGAGDRKALTPCNAKADEAEVLLSGITPVIEVGELLQSETVNISTNPLGFAMPAPRTVFVSQPFITLDEIRPLRDNGAFKDDYTVVVYISEIDFSDGTRWEGKVK
ncbi:MAG: hypothetical protein QOH41_2335 [Blastocatellia bacterium]|jgi:hypothetical protein|nr:hypothetical protein [Blastocatellia bacterium]